MTLTDEVYAERVAGLAGFLTLGQGFDLFLLISPGPEETARFAHELVAHLGEPWSVVRLDPYEDPEGRIPAVSHERLVERVGQPLVEGRAPGAGEKRVVLVDATDARPQDQRTWDLFFAWLSRNRNLIARRLGCPLLLALNRRQYVEFAGMAPDLWSIRSEVVELEPRPPEQDEAGTEVDPVRTAEAAVDRAEVQRLLERAFSTDGLRSIIIKYFDIELIDTLPDAAVSHRLFTASVIEQLSRRGQLHQLGRALLDARPWRAEEIRAAFEAGARPRQARGVAAPLTQPQLHRPVKLPPGVPVVVLASYNPEEVLPDRPNRLRLYRPADDTDRSAWEPTFGGGLLELRGELQRTDSPAVLLHPVCTLSVAMRAGAVFHARSWFQVWCTQRESATGKLEVWDLCQRSALPASVVIHEQADPDPRERHLLVSASLDVRPAWERWRFAQRSRAVTFHLEPGLKGPQPLDLQGVLGWALAAANAVHWTDAAHLPLRVFVSGPMSLGVALGMQLHGQGQVHLMDFDPRAGGYVESFRFGPGAGVIQPSP